MIAPTTSPLHDILMRHIDVCVRIRAAKATGTDFVQSSEAVADYCRRAGITPEDCAATMNKLATRMGVGVPEAAGLGNDEAAA